MIPFVCKTSLHSQLLQAANLASRGRGAVSSSARAFSVRYPRSIMHPQYKNMSHLEAENYLTEVTKRMLRPSRAYTIIFMILLIFVAVVSEHTFDVEIGCSGARGASCSLSGVYARTCTARVLYFKFILFFNIYLVIWHGGQHILTS